MNQHPHHLKEFFVGCTPCTTVHGVHPNVINLSSIARYGVIPAKAGIQSFYAILDPGFRRGDGASDHFILKLMTLKCTLPKTSSKNCS